MKNIVANALYFSSPRRLADTWDFPVIGQFAKTNSAKPEFPHIGPLAPASETTPHDSRSELRLSF